MKLRVFLADDHPVVLAGVRALVLADAGMQIVGEARDGPSTLQRVSELCPDVTVLDLSMPGMNGIEVARRLRERGSACRILVLTVHEDRAYLRQLMDAGVAGYLLKRSAADELCRAIRSVAEGGVYLDPAIAGTLLDRGNSVVIPCEAVGAVGGRPELSEREAEVLRLTASGHSNKVIANALEIGLKTVETYKARAMTKLGFHSRVEVIRFALRQGWLDKGEEMSLGRDRLAP